jgi:hypothetical protein
MFPLMNFRALITAILVMCTCASLSAQDDTTKPAKRPNFAIRYLNHVLNNHEEPSKPQFMAYPTLAYAPETSWEFGISSLYVFHAKRDTTNRLSEVSAFTFFTLEKQYGVILDNALYSNDNKWFVLGHSKFQSYPLLYFGIGPESGEHHIAQVNAVTIQARQRVLRKVYKNLYVGAEFDFQRLSNVEFVPSSTHPIHLPHGHTGYANLEIGMGLVYDNRHNVLNVRHGIYSEVAFLHSDKSWGSDFNMSTVFVDQRLYVPVMKRNVLALQAVGQFNSGTVPFNQLALMGGEQIMRGYYLGRYRDNNLIAAQAEFRMLPLPYKFTKRWGLAAFIAAGTVFPEWNHVKFDHVVLAGGGGVRFLIFQKKDIFTRVDVAFTREGPGFYIFVGEAF